MKEHKQITRSGQTSEGPTDLHMKENGFATSIERKFEIKKMQTYEFMMKL